MATFITTIKFTQQGIKGIDDTIRRAAALKAAGKKLGAKVIDISRTLGENTRRLCFASPGQPRPTEFASPAGSQQVLVRFEREKSQ